MDLLIAATPHAHVTRPCSRNPADFAGLDEQLAVVKVRTISQPESDLDSCTRGDVGQRAGTRPSVFRSRWTTTSAYLGGLAPCPR